MKKATFVFKKADDGLWPAGDIQQRLYDAWIAGVPDGFVASVTFVKQRKPKSNPQLGYWYAVLMPFAVRELREAGYDSLAEIKVEWETNDGHVDEMFKYLFAQAKGLPETPRKRNMSTEDMGQLIDFTMEWLAKNLHVIAPEPERTT